MLLLQMRCRIEALESGRADHPEPIMLTDDERETALTKMAEKPGGNIAASCVREMLCRIKALEANHSTAAELRARIEALEAPQHAHADLSHLSDAEREQMAQELVKPSAWRPLEVETTYGSEHAADTVQILSPRMVVEGTFEHGGETYRFKARPERQGQPAPMPPQIASSQELYQIWDSSTNVSSALCAVYDLGRQHGSAQATCPHIVSSDEGTSYCRLAEQGIAPVSAMAELRAASAEAQPGGLVERVANAISEGDEPDKWHPEARDAIREVAAWLRENDSECQMGGDAAATAELLEQEADHG